LALTDLHCGTNSLYKKPDCSGIGILDNGIPLP
jgi:hypothetical protein